MDSGIFSVEFKGWPRKRNSTTEYRNLSQRKVSEFNLKHVAARLRKRQSFSAVTNHICTRFARLLILNTTISEYQY